MTQVDAPGPDPLIGQSVAGKYKIVQLLGEGGMGCVYLAEQQLGETTRKVALKTLHKHLSHDKSIKKRFDREAGTIAGLQHPNTIQVFDFGAMPDGTLYLVMEYVQGKSVADTLIAEGAMQPARVENILRQVTGSLAEAHGQGIVHRDLKPDNVVLCERAGEKDWVEVLDFGIAKRSSEQDPNEAKLTQQGMVLGTPPYMSPEQFTGQPVDLRSDIYALGVMAYEMLTGKLPWEANTAWEWASRHMTEPPRPLETQPLGPHVPERMRNAIARALAKAKEERFSNVREFFDAFAGHGAGAGAPHTAVISPQAGAPVSAGAGVRAKTEMAAPAAITPPYGAMSGMPSNGSPVSAGPAIVPAGPAHHAPQKKGGMGLIVGLGALALLLLGGGGILMVRQSKHTTPDVVTDLGQGTPSASAPASSAAAEDQPPPDTSTQPLAPGSPLAKGTSGGVPARTDAGAKGVPTPQPKTTPPTTPTPQIAADPPICVQARAAKARNNPAAPVLERQCIAAGGHL
jgi:serine/threonine-protein kinase